MNTLDDLLDPLIDASTKGFPHASPALRRSQIGAQGWNILAGDLPLPLAVVKREALQHNIGWMQRFASDSGVDLAPHGKTTMSPQLFREQLDAGAWGLTFATVAQAAIGAAAGARRLLIANQVLTDADLLGIEYLRAAHAGLQIAFLLDSPRQLELIEAWHARQPGIAAFEVLLEVGVPGGRTGCRDHAAAVLLAERAHGSAAVTLRGIECFEGLGARGQSEADTEYAAALMKRVTDIAAHCDEHDLFDGPEVLVSAGGSAIFDLVATQLKPRLRRPVRGLLRSGCYVTHDHGFYRRMVTVVNQRLGCADGLHPAIEVWAAVQSLPEPGLAILAVGKRDISYDLDLPVPLAWCVRGERRVRLAPEGWRIGGLNDQHAYLHFEDAGEHGLRVGDLVALGISHPCTTFDKWRWMPVVDASHDVVDALVTCF